MKYQDCKGLVCLAASGMLFVVVFLTLPHAVLAQRAEREERSEDREDSSREEREARREAWRNRFGGGEGFRGREFWRGRDRREGDRSDVNRSNESATSAAGASATARSSGSSNGASSTNVKDVARSIVRQHDRDGDNMLKGEELRGLRDRAASADLNSDGVITIDELIIHFTNNTPAAGRPGDGGGSSTNGDSSGRRDRGDRDRFFRLQRGDRDRNSQDESPRESTSAAPKRVFLGSVQGSRSTGSDKNPRRTYRFTPPTERLPEGLPNWFRSRDTNGDGQVSMNEYSREWSRRTVDEFRRYDLNDDGVITPKEAGAK